MLGFINSILGLIDTVLVPVIFAVAFVLFVWGVLQYFFLGAGNEEKRKEGRNFMISALIGFFVMFSLWGIVAVFTRTFGFGNEGRPALPYEDGADAGSNAGNVFQGTGTGTNGAGGTGGTGGGQQSGPPLIPRVGADGVVRLSPATECGFLLWSNVCTIPSHHCVSGYCVPE
jgi:hypothetical protein